MADHPLELSVVMPCLNEADTLGSCVAKALEGIRVAGVRGEVIVADNGSTDGSPQIARTAGARVVDVAERGYGSALMAGIAAARGRWIVMGDADDSYDFREIPRFADRLRAGDAFVMGCRLPAGGGTVAPGAMPALHRWLGNPLFSLLARRWFRAPIHDVYCGLRAFDREVHASLRQRCTGMEFASEMVIKMSLAGVRMSEVPITLHRDGRVSHPPHLRTWRDGWRTLRFYLLLSPRWLFLVPGLVLIIAGLAALFAGWHRLSIGPATFDVSTMLFGSLFVSLGFQAVLLAVFTKVFAINEDLLPPDARLQRMQSSLNLERSLIIGGTALLLGVILLARAVAEWRLRGFGALDTSVTLRVVIPGALLVLLGAQAIFGSFFLGVLAMQKRVGAPPSTSQVGFDAVER